MGGFETVAVAKKDFFNSIMNSPATFLRCPNRGVRPLLRTGRFSSKGLSMVARGLNPRLRLAQMGLRGARLSGLAVFRDYFIRKAFQSDVDVALSQGVDIDQ